MTISLKLIGRDAATTHNLILLYAQIEDPERPGVYESFTCSSRIDKAKFYLEYQDVWIKNYNGSRLLKEGSGFDVTGKTFDKLNEADIAGDGLPWNGLIIVGGEDSAWNYQTYWEPDSRNFEY